MHDARKGVSHWDFLSGAKGNPHIVARSISCQQHGQASASQFAAAENMLIGDQVVRHMRDVLVNRHRLDWMAFC